MHRIMRCVLSYIWLFSCIIMILRFHVVGRVSSVFSGDYFNIYCLPSNYLWFCPRFPISSAALLSSLAWGPQMVSLPPFCPLTTPFPEAAEVNFIISTSDCSNTSVALCDTEAQIDLVWVRPLLCPPRIICMPLSLASCILSALDFL